MDFIKKHRFDIIITCSVIAFIFDLFFKTHLLRPFILALYTLSYTFGDRVEEDAYARKSFLPKGLTREDVKNIAFVKDWEEVRKKGIIRYSLIYGGVFFGFAMCGIISLGCAIINKHLMDYIAEAPSNMFNFIAYTYVAGIISGTVLYRLIWTYNEQKFIRLTDPMH